MKVKYLNPDLPLRDPVTRQYPTVESDGTFTVPENSYWVRRVLARELERVNTPTGREPIAPPTDREPIAPLTTRGKE